jgi:hypothetical protein
MIVDTLNEIALSCSSRQEIVILSTVRSRSFERSESSERRHYPQCGLVPNLMVQ